MRDCLQFIHRGQTVRMHHVPATQTVLEYLRKERGLTGTKEGCAEGDCGACTVVVADLYGDKLRYQAINACIQFLPTLDGKALFTIEDLAAGDRLHPVQQAMVDHHGSQCGFCTPGFVMSLYAHRASCKETTRQSVLEAIAGNLCRCTGYGPIVDAGLNMGTMDAATESEQAATLVRQLERLACPDPLELEGPSSCFFAPTTVAQAVAWYARHPEATVLGGGTDVGLWVTKQHRELSHVLYTGRITELREIKTDSQSVSLGAAVTYAEARSTLVELGADWEDLVRRIGGTQVWNAGTIGGNIANGSPIGDTPPALIAMNATVTLSGGAGTRQVPLEDFFIDYGKQDRRPGELLTAITIPRPARGAELRLYKVSKRFDQDISAVMAAFCYAIDKAGKVSHFRAAYGGMAAIPKRALGMEAALLGKVWSEQTIDDAIHALTEDFAPIDDHRASAWYRQKTAANLLRRCHAESQGTEPVKLFGTTEATYGQR